MQIETQPQRKTPSTINNHPSATQIKNNCQNSKNPSFSIIILNYNGLKYYNSCLKSVIATSYPNFEVIVVDNASTDNSLEKIQSEFSLIPNIKIVKNKANYGFAEGNNIGSKYAKGDYLIFLNIDTTVEPHWLIEIAAVLKENPSIGAAQCKLLLMDNPELFDSAGHYIDWFGITYVRGHKKRDEKQFEHVEKIFGATGAAMIMQNVFFKKIGGFDKDFFMLFEETDLCWRTWLSGFQVVYIPKAIVHHKSGGIRSKDGSFRSLCLSRRNRIVSILKNYSLRNIIIFFPIHLALMNFIILFTKDKTDYLRAMLYAEKSVLADLKNITKKRHFIQSMRKISDKHLFDTNIIKKPCIREMFENGF